MNTTISFNDLTINDILAIANGDEIDDQELAARLARRLVYAVRCRMNSKLTEAEASEFGGLIEVTDRDIARLGQRSIFKVWIRQGGTEGTLSYEVCQAVNAEQARAWVARGLPEDCVIERVQVAVCDDI